MLCCVGLYFSIILSSLRCFAGTISARFSAPFKEQVSWVSTVNIFSIVRYRLHLFAHLTEKDKEIE